MSERVRFGFLGFGHHAVRRMMPGFIGSTHCTVSGLWRRDQEQAQANAAQYGIAHVFATPEELCMSPDVDVVFIASPDALHLEHTLLAFKHGKPVLCEKPVAMNAAEAAQMVAAAKHAKLLFGVAQNFRFNRSVQLIRQWIQEGRIGKPLLAHAQYAYAAKFSPRTWIYDPSLACGGPIADVGVHCMDALRYVLDEDITSVSTLARSDADSGNVEAFASLQLVMSKGTYANVTCTTRSPYRTLIEVTGDDGVIVAENGLTVDRPLEVHLRRNGELIQTEQMSNNDAYSEMLDCFVLALQGKTSFPASGEDGVQNMRAVDAAFRSWLSGMREQI
ncbi:MAG: Gfo/Idh/MocA family protein [Acidobacteriaceae bacterium]